MGILGVVILKVYALLLSLLVKEGKGLNTEIGRSPKQGDMRQPSFDALLPTFSSYVSSREQEQSLKITEPLDEINRIK